MKRGRKIVINMFVIIILIMLQRRDLTFISDFSLVAENAGVNSVK